jgi:hypothetical protein
VARAASAPAPAAGAASGAGARAGAVAAVTPPARPAAEPGARRPFADVTKDARREEGFISVWRKDEKVWLEVPRELLDKPFFFTERGQRGGRARPVREPDGPRAPGGNAPAWTCCSSWR